MNILKYVGVLLSVLVLFVCMTGTAYSQMQVGKQVPVFSLKSLDGETYDLAAMKDNPMTIIYFFDATSRPSQESLLTMDQLVKKYEGADLKVWGITRSAKPDVADFVKKTKPVFPILLDDSGVSKQYQAEFILPATCIVGPDLTMLDYFQGGGKTTNVMLVRLAERKLQQKQTMLAQALSEEAVKKDPKDSKARMIKGYAELKSGRINEAEKTFASMAQETGQEEILGKEGLSGVYLAKGETGKALELASEVEKASPERSYAHTVKGDILYSQNKKDQAMAEYTKAVQNPGAEDFQKAGAYNKLGRLYASLGDFQQSRDLYDQAVQMDPYYVEAMSNKGVAYEKEGQWDNALDMYRKSQGLDNEDVFASALAKRAADMLALQQDSKNKERVDKLVKELSERFRSEKKIFMKPPEDTWTSRPMVLSFVDFQETGALSERDGLSVVLATQLAEELNASGRVKVVERVVIERLLEELNLGSSELADPETALRLGRVLAAKLIGTGSLLHMGDGSMLSLRLVDTETTAIPKVINRELKTDDSLKKDLYRLNREILSTVMTNYPLHAYVVTTAEDKVMINLGSNQGVVMGTKFAVIEEQEPIEYKGKKLRQEPRKTAELEVISVEPDISYCKVIEQERPLKADDKVIEKVDEQLIKG